MFGLDVGGEWKMIVKALIKNRNQNCLEPKECMSGSTEDLGEES